MPRLAEVQDEMMAALLFDGTAPITDLFDGARIDPKASLGVHRGTIFGAITNALRLTFPTVHRLVGEGFFGQAAAAFTRASPPREARFQSFCTSFPQFLKLYPLARSLPYLADVAHFDLALEHSAHRTSGWRRAKFALSEQIGFQLLSSLHAIESDYPVDAIRSALDQDAEHELSSLDMSPNQRWMAVWRSSNGPCSRPLSAAAGKFLHALLSRQGVEDALEAALETDEMQRVLAAIQTDVLAAPFARVFVH